LRFSVLLLGSSTNVSFKALQHMGMLPGLVPTDEMFINDKCL